MIDIYDIETYPNFFCCAIKELSGEMESFEISARRNDFLALRDRFMRKGRKVGFNNLAFDYPVLHHMFNNGADDANAVYKYANAIINEDGPRVYIGASSRLREQIDLFRIWHFNNRAKTCSLKQLEFVMRSERIEDLPFPPGTMVAENMFDTVLDYNRWDVTQTEKFYLRSLDKIAFREALNPAWINCDDVKIGQNIFVHELDKTKPGTCYHGREPRRTIRSSVRAADVILPCVEMTTLWGALALASFESMPPVACGGKLALTSFTVRSETLEGAANPSCPPLHFGAGGLHGAVEGAAFAADADTALIDLDVASYYPSLAIVHHLYPEHLGELFVEIYSKLRTDRLSHPKGTVENAALKLALNGTFGNSNNRYSPMYDPKYTLAITINGQLLLCMLVESLLEIDGVKIVQVNTDGVSAAVPRSALERVTAAGVEWESATGMTLERTDYARMWVRDVNNYLAEGVDGRVKRKGAFEWRDLEPHKDHGALVIQRAVEAYLLKGVDVGEFMSQHDDPFDFLLLEKQGRAKSMHYCCIGDTPSLFNKTPRYVRYYVAPPETGFTLVKQFKNTTKAEGPSMIVVNDYAGEPIAPWLDWYCEQAWELMESAGVARA